MAFIVIDQSKPSSAHTQEYAVASHIATTHIVIANYGLNYSLKANNSYILWSYDILHEQVCGMVTTICDTFVWKYSCGYTHEAPKQSASKTKHLGKHALPLYGGLVMDIEALK